MTNGWFQEVRTSWTMKATAFSPSRENKTMRCGGAHERVERDAFRPDNRIH